MAKNDKYCRKFILEKQLRSCVSCDVRRVEREGERPMTAKVIPPTIQLTNYKPTKKEAMKTTKGDYFLIHKTGYGNWDITNEAGVLRHTTDSLMIDNIDSEDEEEQREAEDAMYLLFED